MTSEQIEAMSEDEYNDYMVSDEYAAVMPVHTDSRNTNHYVIDSDGVTLAGPMGASCAARVAHNLNTLWAIGDAARTELKKAQVNAPFELAAVAP